MKKIFIFLFIAILLLFASCGSANYRDDISCNTVINSILSKNDKEFAEYDSYYTDYIINDASLYDDCRILYSVEANDIDEIGIFRATNKENAQIIRQKLLAYIEDMRNSQRAFIESYAKEELPKLDVAKVEAFGNYVVYIISDTDSINKTISATENALA